MPIVEYRAAYSQGEVIAGYREGRGRSQGPIEGYQTQGATSHDWEAVRGAEPCLLRARNPTGGTPSPRPCVQTPGTLAPVSETASILESCALVTNANVSENHRPLNYERPPPQTEDTTQAIPQTGTSPGRKAILQAVTAGRLSPPSRA